MQVTSPSALRVARALSLELTDGKAALPPELQNVVSSTPVDQATLTRGLVDDLNERVTGSATFVSTPITGGPRLMAFLEKHQIHQLDGGLPVFKDGTEKQAYFDEVVIPNKNHADEVTATLRQHGTTTFESAGTERLPGFTNPDYNRHWMDVVSNVKALDKVVVCDGWQFSFGTLLEVRAALDRGVTVADERGQAIDTAEATRQVGTAITEAARHGVDFSKLGLVMQEPDIRQGPISL